MSRDLFPVLEPPSGGLAELRSRMQADRRRTSRLPRWALAATAVAAIAVVPWLTYYDEPFVLDLASAPSAMKLGVVPMPAAAVVVPLGNRNKMSVSAMESGSDDVIYYWVASTQPSTFGR